MKIVNVELLTGLEPVSLDSETRDFPLSYSGNIYNNNFTLCHMTLLLN